MKNLTKDQLKAELLNTLDKMGVNPSQGGDESFYRAVATMVRDIMSERRRKNYADTISHKK